MGLIDWTEREFRCYNWSGPLEFLEAVVYTGPEHILIDPDAT